MVLYGSLFLAACGGSRESKARELQQAQESWDATVQLTTELRQRGAVPAKYARDVVQAAQQELEKSRRRIQELSQ
jgi:hypothetical protein